MLNNSIKLQNQVNISNSAFNLKHNYSNRWKFVQLDLQKKQTQKLSDTEFCLKWLKMFWVVLGVKFFILLTKLCMCVSMIADWLQSPASTGRIYRALHSLDQHTQSGPAHHTGKWMQLSRACFDCRLMCFRMHMWMREVTWQAATRSVWNRIHTCCTQFPRKCVCGVARGCCITPDLSVYHNPSRGNRPQCQLSAEGSL